MKGSYKWSEGHGAGEDQMTKHPRGQEVWFILVKGGNHGGDAAWWAGGEVWTLIFWRANDEWKDDGASEGDDGKHDERERANATDVAEGVVRFLRGGGV